MKKILILIFITSIIFFSCKDESTGPNDEGILSAVPAKTIFTQSDSVEIRIKNSTGASIYFTQCTESSVEGTIQKKENGSWTIFTMTACGYYEVSAYRMWPQQVFIQKAKINTNGTYRFLFRIGKDRNVVSDTLYSGEFNVVD